MNIYNPYLSLRNHSTNGLEVVLEVGRYLSGLSVVSGDSVDSRLFDGESVLGVLVVSVLLKMLSDGESFLDQMIQVFGNLGGQSMLFENSLDFLSRQKSHLSNAVRVSQNNSDLRF